MLYILVAGFQEAAQITTESQLSSKTKQFSQTPSWSSEHAVISRLPLQIPNGFDSLIFSFGHKPGLFLPKLIANVYSDSVWSGPINGTERGISSD